MAYDLVPGLEGVPIAESAVSRVDGQAGTLEYRGYSVEELAEKSNFEEVSFLLLFNRWPSQAEYDGFRRDMARYRKLKFRIIDLVKCLPDSGHPMEALQAATAAVGMFYPERHNFSEASKRINCMRLIAKTATLVAAFERIRRGDEHIQPRPELSHAANFLYLRTGEDPDPLHEKILDVCLILHADHTMNASTFAGRVVGSTLADPYCVVSSAMGALSGPLHGGANEEAMKLFKEIGDPKKVRPIVEGMIAEKKKIPGFGHRVYKTMDPRARVLKRYAEQLAAKGDGRLFSVAVEVEKVVLEHYAEKGIWPNVDLYSGLVYAELGIPMDCFTPIFAMARVSGWLAHWLEQLQNNRIYRPTQKFIGEKELKFVPISARK